jgi:hypothetical protein
MTMLSTAIVTGVQFPALLTPNALETMPWANAFSEVVPAVIAFAVDVAAVASENVPTPI